MAILEQMLILRNKTQKPRAILAQTISVLTPAWNSMITHSLPMTYIYVIGYLATLVSPISRPCTFPPAHWWLILLINDFSLVIGDKLLFEYLGFSLLVANYSRNIPFFLPWRPGCRHILYVH